VPAVAWAVLAPAGLAVYCLQLAAQLRSGTPLWPPMTAFERTVVFNSLLIGVAAGACATALGAITASLANGIAGRLRQVFELLVAVPFALPDFAIAFALRSLLPTSQGFWPALAVLTVSAFPIAHFQVGVGLARIPRQALDVLWVSGIDLRTKLLRVYAPVLLPYCAAAFTLSSLLAFTEFGTYAIFGYQTVTTAVLSELRSPGGIPYSFQLSWLAAAIGITLLGATLLVEPTREAVLPQQFRLQSRGGGRATFARSSLAFLIVGSVSLMPIAVLVNWTTADKGSPPHLASAAATSLAVAASAAAAATVAAFGLAAVATRLRPRTNRVASALLMLPLSVPSVSVAAGAFLLASGASNSLTFTYVPLAVVYSLRYLPAAVNLAIQAVNDYRDSVRPILSLYAGSRVAAWRAAAKYLAPSAAAAFTTVAGLAVNELPAALILVPPGGETLSTRFWGYTATLSFHKAAPFALAICGICLLLAFSRPLVNSWVAS
jgi:iron(III) transport system permease protein